MHEHRYDAALTILLDVDRQFSDSKQINGLIGSAYLGLGHQHLNQRNYEEALVLFQTGRDYASDEPRLWLGEGVAAYQLGQYADAKSSLQMAIALDSNLAEAYLLLGQVYYAEGFLYDALEMLGQARELDDSTLTRTLLAKIGKEYEIEKNMARDQGGMFQIAFVDDGQSELASEILDSLNQAYVDLGSRINFFPDIRTPVLLYARQDFSVVTRSPGWASAVYDGKIRIPLGGVQRMTLQLKALLYHEYAHVIVHYLGKRRLPTWLNEGYAELAGRSVYAGSLTEFETAVEQGRLLPWAELERPFTELPVTEVALAYQQSHQMVSYLVDHFGWHNLRDLFQALGEGVPFKQAVTETYEEYGLTWRDIEREWSLAHQGK